MKYQHQYDVYVAGFTMRGRRGFHFVEVAGTQNLTWGHVDVAGYLFCGSRGRLICVQYLCMLEV